MRVTVRFFISGRETEVELHDAATLDDCLKSLIQKFPELEQMVKISRFAVGGVSVLRTNVLSENDVITMIPPISGG
ncbi:MAG: MoaD/ThiS family protein [Chloroflexota bacterium]|nr:MAG: MoaD/ThiS family protein [Chloroflexota bacterium]